MREFKEELEKMQVATAGWLAELDEHEGTRSVHGDAFELSLDIKIMIGRLSVEGIEFNPNPEPRIVVDDVPLLFSKIVAKFTECQVVVENLCKLQTLKRYLMLMKLNEPADAETPPKKRPRVDCSGGRVAATAKSRLFIGCSGTQPLPEATMKAPIANQFMKWADDYHTCP
jgi:hypothetical protein